RVPSNLFLTMAGTRSLPTGAAEVLRRLQQLPAPPVPPTTTRHTPRIRAATPKFEAKRHGASDHSNNCRLVPLANILPQTLQALLTVAGLMPGAAETLPQGSPFTVTLAKSVSVKLT